MGTLRTGEKRRRRASGRFPLDLHRHLLLSEQLHAGPAMTSAAPVSPQHRSWSNVERMQEHTHAGVGFIVALPCHWHCSRREQGRQLRMLAAYTTRKLPSASRRRSCAESFCPAGQRKEPSGWKGKSRPEKRPAFQEDATSAGPYPCTGEARSV